MGVLRLTRISLLLFTVSVALGAIFAAIFLRQNPLRNNVSQFKKFFETPHEESYAKFLNARNLKQMKDNDERSTLPVNNAVIMQESDYLLDTFPILCWVMLRTDAMPISTWPYLPDLMTSGQAIRDTWARHCKHIVYFCGPNGYEGMPEAVSLKTQDLSSWTATHEALTHLFENFPMSNFAWVTRVEQDTFLILENLAYYLSIYNASLPHYLGHVYQQWGRSFNVDGPGVTLSRGAMMLIRNAFSKGHCPPLRLKAAAALAQCLAEQGVYPQDTRDRQGRGRFLMHQPELLLVPGSIPWSDGFWMHTKYMSSEGPDCCSDYAITFHYVPPNMMYVFEYMIYHLKPYGISTQLAVPLDDPAASKYMADQQLSAQKNQQDTHGAPAQTEGKEKEETASNLESRRTPMPKNNKDQTRSNKVNSNVEDMNSDLQIKVMDSNPNHKQKIENLDDFDIDMGNRKHNEVVEMKEDMNIHRGISNDKSKM